MKRNNLTFLICLLFCSLTPLAQSCNGGILDKSWKEVANQMPSKWYATPEAMRVAENVLLSQKEIVGWGKNKAYHHPFSVAPKAQKDAPPLWGRFHDLETSRPYFCSRDGIKRSTLAEISHERRNGYSWYTNAPEKIIKSYSEWKLKSNNMDQLEPVNSGVYKWADHPVKQGEMRESRKILEGSSPHFSYLRIHSTTQFPGAAPSTAHANEEFEECIIVKEGTMKATIEGRSSILEAGGVILLMPQQMHSLENVGDTNLTYYVMKYASKKKMNVARGQASGGSLMLNKDSLVFKRSTRGGGISYFDRPTAMCDRFEMHITQLNQKGPSHKPHAHIETEIILVLSGETEMTIDGNEYQATAGDFYFMDSQLLHGVRNATDQPCSYFAFKWN